MPVYLRRNKIKYLPWDFVYTHDNYDTQWKLYAPPKSNKDDSTAPLINKGVTKKIIRKKTDNTNDIVGNSKRIINKEDNMVQKNDMNNVQLPYLEKSHSDFEVNNSVLNQVYFDKALNINKDDKIQSNQIQNINSNQHREKISIKDYHQFSRNKATPLNIQANIVNEFSLEKNKNTNNLLNVSSSSYVPKKILKKEPLKINDAFKTRPENVKLIPDVKIISNDKDDKKNVSAYSKSRKFLSENLKRNQLYYYTYTNQQNLDNNFIQSNENIILNRRKLE